MASSTDRERDAGPKYNGPHSITPLPNGRWLLNDTDNHRVIQLSDLSAKGKVFIRSELAGFALKRPHDQIADPATGDAYLVDGNRRLFRFRDLDCPIEVWTFTPEQLSYVRG